jgi:hypothetical protein
MLPGLLVAAWTVFAVAWIWSNPLGAAPDEPDHYIRALATGYGNLSGTAAPHAPDTQGALTGSRYFTIPAGMGKAPQFACDDFKPNTSAACANQPGSPSQDTVAASNAGTYMPTAYLVPGALMRLASDPYTAMRLGRLGSALLSLSLLGVAAGLLWSRARSAFAFLGLLLAVTPMQIFLLTEVGPNGLEIAAAICFAAAVIRLARPEPLSAWHWLGFAYGGVLLGATRPLGPEWIGGGLLMFLLLAGPADLGRRLRQRPLAAGGASVSVLAAAAVNIWWQSRYPASAHVSVTTVWAAFWDNVNQVPGFFRQMIGDFGWLDTVLPEPIYLAWMVAVVALAVVALMVGTWRQRLLICALGVGIVLLSGALSAYLSHVFGYGNAAQGVQGRYLMPMAIWFPLLCGEIVHLQRERFGTVDPRRLLLYLALLAAFVQFDAWYTNSRRYAVGANGPLNFLRRTAWQPPAGWGTWVVLALIASGLLVLFGVVGLGPIGNRRPSPPRVGVVNVPA